MKGCGRGILDFGNCFDSTVKVFLNGKPISIAYAKIEEKLFTLNKIVEFDFEDGDLLELQEGHSIILFNSFHVINCGMNPNHGVTQSVQKPTKNGILLGKLVLSQK